MTAQRPPARPTGALPPGGARAGAPRPGGAWARNSAKPDLQAALAHPGLASRVAAAAILADVAGGHPLDDIFAGDPPSMRLSSLDTRDKSLVRSIVTVAMRRLGTLRKAIARFIERPLPKKSAPMEWLLVCGAAQILFLDIPDHAAVDLAVRAARLDPAQAGFAGLVNAVLRNIARHKDEILEASDPLVDDTPAWLAARWRKHYGAAAAAEIAAAHRQEPTLDLSVKSDAAGWAERLDGLLLPTGTVRLRGHAQITDLPGFEAGEWWVQDAAAALPARLVGTVSGERVGDLCAAPGGKTAQLALAGAQVVAVDRSAERLKRLSANFARLRLSAEMRVADALTFQAAPFDAILLDAPCTATGTIRRHPDVAWIKRASDLATLGALQAQLLTRAASLLKPGGRLVYCTCSIEPEEGPAQIAALLRRDPDLSRLPIDADEIGGLADCVTEEGDMRSLPHYLPHEEARLAGMDGFFAARLKRRA